MDSFVDVFRIAIGVVGVICLIPVVRSKKTWVKAITAFAAVLLTGISFYLIAQTGRGVEETFVCSMLPDSPGCAAKDIRSTVAQSPGTLALSPCQEIAAAGFLCNPEGLLDATRIDKPSLIELYLEAGIHGNLVLSKDESGEPLPVWVRALADRAPAATTLLNMMTERGMKLEGFMFLVTPWNRFGYSLQVDEATFCRGLPYLKSQSDEFLKLLDANDEEEAVEARKYFRENNGDFEMNGHHFTNEADFVEWSVHANSKLHGRDYRAIVASCAKLPAP